MSLCCESSVRELQMSRHCLLSASPTLGAIHCRSIGYADLPRECYYGSVAADGCQDLVPIVSGSFDGSLLNSLHLLSSFQLFGYYNSIKGDGMSA